MLENIHGAARSPANMVSQWLQSRVTVTAKHNSMLCNIKAIHTVLDLFTLEFLHRNMSFATISEDAAC